MEKKLKVTLKRSLSGRLPKHRATVKALGFHRLQETRIIPDNPAMRGMIRAVSHMVVWEEIMA